MRDRMELLPPGVAEQDFGWSQVVYMGDKDRHPKCPPSIPITARHRLIEGILAWEEKMRAASQWGALWLSPAKETWHEDELIGSGAWVFSLTRTARLYPKE